MSKRILAIDDNTTTLMVIKAALSRVEDFHVDTTDSASHAFELLESHNFDLVISDIDMPDMSGLEFLKAMREQLHLRRTPLMFVTSHSHLNDIQEGLTAGAEHYLTKPFSATSLISAVKAVFAKRELILGHSLSNHHVFVSYSRQDSRICARICDTLCGAGLVIWVDSAELQPGTPSWKSSIQKAIDGCGCMVVLLSPNAKESRWVQSELDYAEIQEKRIYPVLVRGNKRTAAPFGYTLAQWVDVQEDYEAAMEQLIRTIKKHLGLT